MFAKIDNPPIFETWEELINATPPKRPRVPKAFHILCEDNNPFGVSAIFVSRAERLLERRETRQEVWQNSNIAATKESSGNTLVNTTGIVALFISVVVVLLIVLLVVQRRFLGSGDDAIPAAMMLTMLGSVAVPWRSKSSISWPWSKSRGYKVKSPARMKKKDTDLVYVVDGVTSLIWPCRVPRQVLLDKGISPDSSFSPVLNDVRRKFAIVGGLVFLAAGAVAMFPVFVTTGSLDLVLGTTVIPFGFTWISPIGAALGWLIGDRFAEPFWVLEREATYDDQGNPIIICPDHQGQERNCSEQCVGHLDMKLVGFEHTYCRGIRREAWLEETAIDINQFIDGAKAAMEKAQGQDGGTPAFGMSDAPEQDGYRPVILRANEVYDSLRGDNEKGWLKTSLPGAQKAQITVMVVLAGIVLLALILALSMTAT